MVKLSTDKTEKVYSLLDDLFSFGLLPLRVSEIREISPGKWEVCVSLASYLSDSEVDKIISLILSKGGEGMKVLFVIDMINDFIEPEGKLYIGNEGRRIIPFIKEKVEEFRRTGKVIFICDAHSEDDKEFNDWPPHAVKGTWGSRVIKELKPQSGDILIEKKTYNGFIKTSLESVLKDLSVKEIYSVGVLTNICVLYTSAHAKMLGYDVKVYKNGCASISQEKHDWAIKEMEESLKIGIL